jgi:hypothetical protein
MRGLQMYTAAYNTINSNIDTALQQQRHTATAAHYNISTQKHTASGTQHYTSNHTYSRKH